MVPPRALLDFPARVGPGSLATCDRRHGGGDEADPLDRDDGGERSSTADEVARGDGEGCARIVDRDALTAGRPSELVIEYTVGPSGLRAGAAVAVGLHHGGQWRVQTGAPAGKGFVHLRSDDPDNLRLDYFPWVPRGMFRDTRPGLNSDSIFHRLLVATVTERTLAPGERIQLHFGDNEAKLDVPPSVDLDHQFRVTSDVDGDGVFEAIARSPVIEIGHDEARALNAIVPSQVLVGDPFDVHLRMEDAFHNVARSWHGTVQVVDEHGVVLAEDIPLTDGAGQARIAVTSSGPHRLRLRSADGRYRGRSNPFRVSDTLPERRLYWADLHGHTGVSDGLGRDADEYFRFGRDVARLDVIALTDHGHFDWPANVAAVKRYHEPGEYVTLLAQEAGAGPDHMNVYFRADDTPHLSRWHEDYGEFLHWLDHQYNERDVQAIAAPHHFAYDRGPHGDPRYPFGTWDERAIRFIEVYSAHGTSEFPGNPRPLAAPSADERKYMQTALANGRKFGVIAASDNHDSRPGRSAWGRYAGGLAGIWADELTREAVWNALHDRRTYGTSLDRIYLDLRVDGEIMGSSTVGTGPVEIRADIIGKRDRLTAVLIRDNEEIAELATSDGVLDLRHTDRPGPGEHFYYVRVTQEDGERAWSSPVWVTR